SDKADTTHTETGFKSGGRLHSHIRLVQAPPPGAGLQRADRSSLRACQPDVRRRPAHPEPLEGSEGLGWTLTQMLVLPADRLRTSTCRRYWKLAVRGWRGMIAYESHDDLAVEVVLATSSWLPIRVCYPRTTPLESRRQTSHHRASSRFKRLNRRSACTPSILSSMGGEAACCSCQAALTLHSRRASPPDICCRSSARTLLALTGPARAALVSFPRLDCVHLDTSAYYPDSRPRRPMPALVLRASSGVWITFPLAGTSSASTPNAAERGRGLNAAVYTQRWRGAVHSCGGGGRVLAGVLPDPECPGLLALPLPINVHLRLDAQGAHISMLVGRLAPPHEALRQVDFTMECFWWSVGVERDASGETLAHLSLHHGPRMLSGPRDVSPLLDDTRRRTKLRQ
ncbi:hypothetical protein C8R46DRAFT_1278096, partial [Mycena filopes]